VTLLSPSLPARMLSTLTVSTLLYHHTLPTLHACSIPSLSPTHLTRLLAPIPIFTTFLRSTPRLSHFIRPERIQVTFLSRGSGKHLQEIARETRQMKRKGGGERGRKGEEKEGQPQGGAELV
jgi:hypothetical protein